MLMQISISPARTLWIDFMEMEKILRGRPGYMAEGVGGAWCVRVLCSFCSCWLCVWHVMHVHIAELNGLVLAYAIGNTTLIAVGIVPVLARLARINASVSSDTCSGVRPLSARRWAID